MKYSSELLEKAVKTYARLPGIGQKTALRLVLHLAQKDKELASDLVAATNELVSNLRQCEKCGNLADQPVCTICSDRSRDEQLICVVGSARDVMALEDTNHYRGMYHVLGGVISPIDGIGPEQLNIEQLIDRIQQDSVKEVIMAINPTIEGETTIFYISNRLKDLDVRISVLARGISFGGELEYADELTLGRSIITRTPYDVNREH